jgi:arylsulfatase A-like enzyme
VPATEKNKTPLNFTRVAVIIIVVATAWVLSEWLFFITKPSFMSLYSAWEKAAVLSGTALIMSVALVLGSLPFIVLAWALNRFTHRRLLVSAMVFFPASLLLALTLLLLTDNFTLTLFGWGIRNASTAGIWLYRIITIALVIYATRLLHRLLNKRDVDTGTKAMAVTAGLIVLAGLPLVVAAVLTSPDDVGGTAGTDRERLNILIMSGDGIWAKHMSLYGYERPTTPFMDSVRDEFLIAENHFANAAETGGSVVSMLSGKFPTTTRVIYPPDILRGSDSFEHLPGLLKKLGYYNADISMRHYADPYDLNMRGGFAEANFRKLRDTGGTLVALIRSYPGLNATSLLTDRISERLSQRLGHVWKNKAMLDPMAVVNTPDKRFIRDDARMEEIHRFIRESKQPFFLHVHMMGTHGTRFRPRERIYSTEESYPLDWVEDGYDDAIIDFDRYVKETYKLLKESGMLDSTIFVISSDHGYIHDPLHRIPLMLRLPGRVDVGTIGGNTQRLDLAPTLLEAMSIEVPAWMEGQSMLSTDAGEPGTRPIFASGSAGGKSVDGNFWSISNPQPPWYSLGRLFMVNCNQGFVLLLDSMELQAKSIDGSTLQCEDKLSMEDARQLMLAHLKERGY